MKRFINLFSFAYIRFRLNTLNREAALDSVRNVLCVFGAAGVLGMLAVMRWFFVLPGFAFLVLVWYMDYLRHDFHPHETAMENARSAHESIVGLLDQS